jgi:hypothetical protein
MLTKPAQECLGALVFSSCVAFRLENDFQFTADITNMIQLFRSGDWGDLDEDDWKFNIQTCKSTSGGSLMGWVPIIMLTIGCVNSTRSMVFQSIIGGQQ